MHWPSPSSNPPKKDDSDRDGGRAWVFMSRPVVLFTEQMRWQMSSSTLSGVSGPPTGNPLHPWVVPCEGKKRMLTSTENKANTLVCKVQAIIKQNKNMNVKDWEVNIKVSDSYMSTASMLQLNVHTMLLYIQGVKLLFAVRDFDHQLHWYYSILSDYCVLGSGWRCCERIT